MSNVKTDSNSAKEERNGNQASGAEPEKMENAIEDLRSEDAHAEEVRGGIAGGTKYSNIVLKRG